MASNRLGGQLHAISVPSDIAKVTLNAVARPSTAASAKAARAEAAASSDAARSDHGCSAVGEMAQQDLIDHRGNESAPQKLLQLVGYRDPSRPAATARSRRRK